MDRKIKLLFIGDFITKTGFSRVAENVLTNLPQEDYDISILGVNHFGEPHNFPYRVYPAMTPMAVQTGDVQGFNRVQEIITKEMPDIIFLLNDIWIINRHLEIFAGTFTAGRPKIVIYFPVDARFHNSLWYKGIDQGWVDEAVVYTEFGKEVASLACPSFGFKIIPHGVDTKTFHKLPGSKTMIKKALFPNEPTFYDDSFVVLNANRNQPRKMWWLTLEAFKLFSENKPENVKLHIHAGMQDSDMNLQDYTHRLGILDRITASSKQVGPQQVPDAKLNHIYNACDVGMNSSVGEGWGLPNFEHGATGAPQVIPDNSANHEIWKDCGLLVPPIMNYTLSEMGTKGSICKAEDIAERLEWLYVDKGLYDSLSVKTFAMCTDPKFSWTNIAKTWDKTFKSVLEK